MKWPSAWSNYVSRKVHPLKDRSDFGRILDDYKECREYGDKEHRRATDVDAGSLSPQNTRVAPMFFEGAKRLFNSDVMSPALRSGDPLRVVVEAYPGVFVRDLFGRKVKYKSDTRNEQTQDQRLARQTILDSVLQGAVQKELGFSIVAPQWLASNPTGDHLDALLCAVQAVWASSNREINFDLREPTEPIEGRIAHTIWEDMGCGQYPLVRLAVVPQ